MGKLTMFLGAPDEVAEPTFTGGGYTAPAQAGICRGVVKTADSSTPKSCPDGGCDMFRLGVSVRTLMKADGDDEKNEGWAEHLLFNVDPAFYDRKTKDADGSEGKSYLERFTPKEQSWRMRNFFFSGLGLGDAIAKGVDAKGKKSFGVDPAKWVGQEVIFEISIYDDVYKGEKRRKARIGRFYTEAEAAEALQGTTTADTGADDGLDGEEDIPTVG
jgi:hypothetical protein